MTREPSSADPKCVKLEGYRRAPDARGRDNDEMPSSYPSGGSKRSNIWCVSQNADSGPKGKPAPPNGVLDTPSQNRNEEIHLIALAGPSGVGKSYAASKAGLHVVDVDRFFLDASDPRIPRMKDQPDWEDIRSFDLALARSTVRAMLSRESVELPMYSYSQDKRMGWRQEPPVSGPCLLIEGTFAFDIVETLDHAALTTCVLLTAGSFTCALSRIIRDVKEHRYSIGRANVESWRLWRRHATQIERLRTKADLETSRRTVVETLLQLCPR